VDLQKVGSKMCQVLWGAAVWKGLKKKGVINNITGSCYRLYSVAV